MAKLYFEILNSSGNFHHCEESSGDCMCEGLQDWRKHGRKFLESPL